MSERVAHDETSPERALARFVQRHERRLIVVWLAGTALVLAGLAYWAVLSRGAELTVEALDARWVAKIDRCAALVEAERYDEAIALLEPLEREFPAQFIKHHLDRERERLLGLLGASYVATDKKGKALAAFERLAAFDPRNFDNHFRHAEALRHFADGGAAREAYERVLAIHPTHLPSVTAELDMAWAGSLYAQIVEDYERYLNAWLLARVRVRAGERTVDFDVLVDGNSHVLEGALELPDGFNGPLSLETRGFSARLGVFELTPPLRAGVVEPLAPVVVALDAPWSAIGGALVEPRTLSASGDDSALALANLDAPRGVARVKLELTLFKTLPEGMHTKVAKSYSNRLEHAKWRAASARSLVGGSLNAGSVFAD